MTEQTTAVTRTWWTKGRPFTAAELVADGVIHAVGLLVAICMGSVLLAFAALETAPEEVPAIAVYVASLVMLLAISLAFNLTTPVSPRKRVLARLDQAAIFLFIAGTYTPFLAVLSHTRIGHVMMIFIWGAALVGMALKLIVPQRFGRAAIFFYLAIGWSGILVFQALAEALPSSTVWLLIAGGATYSFGIVFHLWERLRFHNALWHAFVVVGASLHLWAILDCMVLKRL